MRIMLMTRFYKNGQTTHVLDLCAELRRRGHEVLLNISQLDDPSYFSWLTQRRIIVFTTSESLRLKRYLQMWRPEIIHNHSSHTLPQAILLGKLLGTPTLSTVHYLDFGPIQLLDQQAAVVLISAEMRTKFAGLKAPSFVVENGVPLPATLLSGKPWRQRALFLARTSPQKLENFRKMSANLLKWGWEIDSAGDWRFPGIRRLGWIKDVEPVLKQSDLVIGTGRAIREAMAMGCLAWVLGEFCDGLVTPENVERLRHTNFSGRTSKTVFCSSTADILQKLLPRQLVKLQKFGRTYAKMHFSIWQMAEELETIYRLILENHRRY